MLMITFASLPTVAAGGQIYILSSQRFSGYSYSTRLHVFLVLVTCLPTDFFGISFIMAFVSMKDFGFAFTRHFTFVSPVAF